MEGKYKAALAKLPQMAVFEENFMIHGENAPLPPPFKNLVAAWADKFDPSMSWESPVVTKEKIDSLKDDKSPEALQLADSLYFLVDECVICY